MDSWKSIAVLVAVVLLAGANAQAARSTGLKFPLTLTWEKGEIGEKAIAIPVKADKTVEADETGTVTDVELIAP